MVVHDISFDMYTANLSSISYTMCQENNYYDNVTCQLVGKLIVGYSLTEDPRYGVSYMQLLICLCLDRVGVSEIGLSPTRCLSRKQLCCCCH
jgi:hypothetical protein